MDFLSQVDLSFLVTETPDVCVSVYLPTHRVGRENMQDPIRLKNLLNEAEQRLVELGLRTPEARDLLEPGRELLTDSDFWQHQSDGLAVFLTEGDYRWYRLPLPFEELLSVTERFHIKPLLPVFSGDGRYYLLALSQNQVRFFQGTRYRIEELELKDIPESLQEALWYDEPERQQQFHTGTQTPSASGSGYRPAIFHGQGLPEKKTDILRFFQQIDAGLGDLLEDQNAPLVLAGVEYLLPIYREANTHPNLITTGIVGNPEEESAESLHARAWEIVQPRFEEDQAEAVGRYQTLRGKGGDMASNQIAEVVPGAIHGRVETLFVATGSQRWGVFDLDTNKVDIHERPHTGDQDLLDLAAAHTLMNSGIVYAMGADQVPAGAPLAAIFRYPLASA